MVNNIQSAPSSLHYGVPQGSVFGAVLFTMYMQPLGPLISIFHHLYHLFADDIQLYDSAKPNNVPGLVQNMSTCVSQCSR